MRLPAGVGQWMEILSWYCSFKETISWEISEEAKPAATRSQTRMPQQPRFFAKLETDILQVVPNEHKSLVSGPLKLTTLGLNSVNYVYEEFIHFY